MATVDPAVAGQYLDQLAADGYTCQELYGGRQCQLIKRDETYPVDGVRTHFVRDGVYIFVGLANVPGKDLVGDIVATLWG